MSIFLSMLSHSVLAADSSFSFAPAPANLAGDLNANKIGIDVVNVSIDGASDVTATTYRYMAKRSHETHDSVRKSVEGFSFYLTTMDADGFDSAYTLGLEFDGVSGSTNGSAFIFSTGSDIQSFTSSDANSSTDILTLIFHLDVGVQQHMIMGKDFTLVPWGKFSYFNVESTVTTESNIGGFYNYDSTNVSNNYSSMSYGLDVIFSGFSLGAMYQQGDNASITKFSISTDF